MAETTVSYQCPNCGAPLSFHPGDARVVCAHCHTELDAAALDERYRAQEEAAAKTAEEKEAAANAPDAQWSEEERAAMQVQTCSACGAELVSDANTMATSCAYCGSPNLLPRRFDGMLRPEVIIPFKKTKEDAVAALKKFYQGRWLLPDAFKDANRIKEIQSMYVPFWLFDADVSASATFRAETDYVTETSDETITETRIYSCHRSGTMSFHAVPADGSRRMDDNYMESIEPFDFSALIPFSPAYLAGHLADKYDVDAKASAPRIDRRVRTSAVSILADTVKGYHRRSLDGNAQIAKRDGAVRYAMVPVWILTTRYENQPYTFMMNGQTGKVVGSLPIDRRKALRYPLIPALIALPLLYYAIKYIIG